MKSYKLLFLLSALILANLTGCQKTEINLEDQVLEDRFIKDKAKQEVPKEDFQKEEESSITQLTQNNSGNKDERRVIINGMVLAEGDDIQQIEEIRSTLVLINKDHIIYHEPVAIDGIRGLVIRKDGVDQYGFTDEAGKRIVEPIYDDAKFYNSEIGSQYTFTLEGLIPVKKDGKWGYIDYEGNEIIPFTYQDAAVFSEGLAAVMLNNRWGYINKQGQVVIDFVYEEARSYQLGLGVVYTKSDRFSFINHYGELIGDYDYINRNPYNRDSLQGTVDIYQPSGMGLVRIKDGEIKTLIEPLYTHLSKRRDGNDDVYDFTYFYYDEKGNMIMEKSYAGLINSNGEEIERYPYSDKLAEIEDLGEEEKVLQFDDTLTILDIKPGIKVLYNKESKQVLSEEYADIELKQEVLVATDAKGNKTVISKTGVEDCLPYMEFSLQEHELGYKLVRGSRGNYHVTSLDDTYCSDWYYDKIYHPQQGYRIVIKELYYGIADIKGNLLIPCVFNKLTIREGDTVGFSYISFEGGTEVHGNFSIEDNISLMKPYVSQLENKDQ